MKRLFLLLIPLIALAGCSSVPAPKPAPQPVPITGPQVFSITPENCPVLRVTRDNGEFSGPWGGANGIFVPVNGFSILAERKQLECRRDGVFTPF